MAHEKPGYLTPEEIQEGIDLCFQNVQDILEECNLLLENGKPARVLALSISAIEEMGKINVLRSINRLPKNKQRLRSVAWKNYFNHKYKSSMSFFNTVPDENRTTIDSIFLSALLAREQADITEGIRQMAIYTSYSPKKKMWHSPRMIDYDLAHDYLQTAITIFERKQKIKELGLYDADVLRLEKEMYKEVFDRIPDEEYDETSLQRISQPAKEKAKQFFDKLIQIGRIAKSDVTFLE